MGTRNMLASVSLTSICLVFFSLTANTELINCFFPLEVFITENVRELIHYKSIIELQNELESRQACSYFE